MKSLKFANLSGKRVLVRVDFNVPLKGNRVMNTERIKQSLPTINYLLKQNCRLILMSHLGRPKGKPVQMLRMKPVALELSNLLNKEVKQLNNCIGKEVEQACLKMRKREIVMLENTRFHPEEKTNDSKFSKKLAKLADVFVFEGFAVSHRKNASTVGVQEFLPSFLGFHAENEFKVIENFLNSPKKPVVVVVGGAKLSDKIGMIDHMSALAGRILIGGAMAFPLLITKGIKVGKSFVEEGSIELAKRINMEKVELPVDFLVAESRDAKEAKVAKFNEIPEDAMGLDIGPVTVALFAKELASAKTIIWNGPLGVFENPVFSTGTLAIALAGRNKISLFGGGETVSAIQKLAPKAHYTHVSVGGGAMLTLLSGKPLPALRGFK